MADRTAIYVLTENGSYVGEALKAAATDFQGIHKDDAQMRVFVRQSEPTKFENARRAFEVRRVPAFVISDEDRAFSSPERVPRFIAFDRGVLERYVVRGDGAAKPQTQEAFYNLISDFHYVLQDEGLLHLKQSLVNQRIVGFLKTTWEEVKDLVSMSVAP